MKYLIILALLIISCTSEKEPNNINVVGLKSELADTKDRLATCEAKLELYRDKNSQELEREEVKHSEPMYETVYRYDIETKHGKATCYNRNGGNGDSGDDELTCGMTFADCKDGYVYRCLTDVKYKITEEQRLIE